MAKKILVIYIDSHAFDSAVKKEVVWEKLMKENSHLKAVDTRLSPKTKKAVFEDGTTIEMFPASNTMSGYRATHLFISKELYDMEVFKNTILSIIVPEDTYELDTEGKSRLERIQTF